MLRSEAARKMRELESSRSGIIKRVYGYAADILSGKIAACKKVISAAERFSRDIVRAETDASCPWYFNETLAVRPSEFQERFLVPRTGTGKHIELMPWQCFVFANLHGFVKKETLCRRFRECLIVVGKGNGKSTMVSGEAAYCASKCNERGAEIYLLANSKDQAGIVFREVSAQIQSAPALSSRFRVTRSEISYPPLGSMIRQLSAESKKKDGLNPYEAIFDEIKDYEKYDLINIIKDSAIKRPDPQILYITTKGRVIDGPLMQFEETFTAAMRGDEEVSTEVADTLFCFICEQESADEFDKPETYIKSNPSIDAPGMEITTKKISELWARAKLSPQERAAFITKQFNVYADDSESTFVDIGVIERNNRSAELSELLLIPCYAGYDLSTREDFTAAALVWRLSDGSIVPMIHSFVPRRKMELDEEKLDWAGLVRAGELTICDGDYVEQEDIERWFCEMRDKGCMIEQIGYDPANAQWLNKKLQSDGFGTQVVRQGPLTFNDPMKSMRELLLSGKVLIGKQRLLRWYLKNVKLRNEKSDTDKNNWYPIKSGRKRKIDGFMAMMDAYIALTATEPVGEMPEYGFIAF